MLTAFTELTTVIGLWRRSLLHMKMAAVSLRKGRAPDIAVKIETMVSATQNIIDAQQGCIHALTPKN
jgi:hypothetical protein